MKRTLLKRAAMCSCTAALVSIDALTVGGQGRPNVARYDVEFSTLGSLLDRNCAATGTDVLAGTLAGDESSPSTEPKQYVGTLARTTRITTCGERTLADGRHVACSMTFTANGFADVMLTVEPGGQGGWLQYLDDRTRWAPVLPPRPAGPVSSSVTGTCDPAEMAQLQNEYDDGETAGSPSGQPIEVDRLPPSSYPATFPPRPPQSIWTLKVLRRHP